MHNRNILLHRQSYASRNKPGGQRNSSMSSGTEAPLPPDGGWGYVCIAAAFILQCLFGLVVRSFGIIYLFLLDRYNTTASLAAWVGATNLLLYGLFGPVTSMLCRWFSHRSVAIVGCLLEAVGFIITGFAPNIATVYLGFGLFAGVGVSMSTIASFLILDKYFLHKKGFATCTAASGVGVAMFVVPPLMNYCEQQYGYMGTMLILAGICLNGIVCAAFFRPVEFPRSQQKGNKEGDYKKPAVTFGATKLDKPIATVTSSDNIVLTSVKSIHVDANSHPAQSQDTPPSSTETLAKHSETEIFNVNMATVSEGITCVVKDTSLTDSKSAIQQDMIKAELEDVAQDHMDLAPVKKTSMFRACIALMQESPAVVGMMLLSFFFTILDSCVYAFLPALAIDQGLSFTDAKLLVSWGGISDMIHRIGYGILMDRQKVRPFRVQMYCVIALLSSAMTPFFPFYSRHVAYVVSVVLFGGFTGVVFAQRVTITADLTGPEKTPLAFGFVVALNAGGHVTGRVIGGLIKDHTGSYDLVFFISGALPAVAATIFLLLVIFGKKRKKNLQ